MCIRRKNKPIIENFRQLIAQRFTDKLAIFKRNFVLKFDYVRFRKERTSMIKLTFTVYSSYSFLLDKEYPIDLTFCLTPNYKSIVKVGVKNCIIN